MSPQDTRQISEPFDWENDLRRWLSLRRHIPKQSVDDIVAFFATAFEHTRCPQRAWYGTHKTRVSLVIGGIYLAAIQISGEDKGVWLLVDQPMPLIETLEFRPVKSTSKLDSPLYWVHGSLLTTLPNFGDLITNTLLWKSFSVATEKILEAPISANRDSFQIEHQKKRISEFWLAQSYQDAEKQFQNEVARALNEQAEIRRERLKSAKAIPNKKERVAIVFDRNSDVVAEVLLRANGHCEHCKSPAPFVRRTNNSPYLEVHHIKTLADGGEDTVENAIALCPNCHRRVHYA